MKVPVELHSVAFDSIALHTGTGSAEVFLAEAGASADSAAELHEGQVVRWMIREPRLRSLILRTLGVPSDATALDGVREPFIRGGRMRPGDIDLLCFSRVAPNLAVAVEFKRVKVRVESSRERVNKLEDVAGAARQLRPLQSLGFSRTFLGLIAVVDGRQRRRANFFFRGISDGTYKQVLELGAGVCLPEDIGLLYIEVVQPADKPIHHACMVSAALAVPARQRSQSSRVTEGVEALPRSLAAGRSSR